jgi:hypothetical protein
MRKLQMSVEMPDDAELLSELTSVDEVKAWIPTDKDHVAEVVPPWCELVLQVRRHTGGHPFSTNMTLNRHDGEAIITALHSTLHPNSGGMVKVMLWTELDEVVDAIQRRVERGKDPLKRDVGKAQGLALAIAIMTNPFAYDDDAVRDEAMDRYEARNPQG